MSEQATGGQDTSAPTTAADPALERVRAENTRLTKALADRQAEREKAEVEAAAKRGEFEKLYTEAKATAKTLEETLAAEKARRTEYEELLTGEVKAALADVADEKARKQLSDALEGLDPLRQRKLLAAYQSALPAGPPRPGAAGNPKRGLDRGLLASPGAQGEKYRMDLVIADLSRGGSKWPFSFPMLWRQRSTVTPTTSSGCRSPTARSSTSR